MTAARITGDTSVFLFIDLSLRPTPRHHKKFRESYPRRFYALEYLESISGLKAQAPNKDFYGIKCKNVFQDRGMMLDRVKFAFFVPFFSIIAMQIIVKERNLSI